jgi:hypothetical protein
MHNLKMLVRFDNSMRIQGNAVVTVTIHRGVEISGFFDVSFLSTEPFKVAIQDAVYQSEEV